MSQCKQCQGDTLQCHEKISLQMKSVSGKHGLQRVRDSDPETSLATTGMVRVKNYTAINGSAMLLKFISLR